MKKLLFRLTACAIALLAAAAITACGDSNRKNDKPTESATESQMSDAAVDEDLANVIEHAGKKACVQKYVDTLNNCVNHTGK